MFIIYFDVCQYLSEAILHKNRFIMTGQDIKKSPNLVTETCKSLCFIPMGICGILANLIYIALPALKPLYNLALTINEPNLTESLKKRPLLYLSADNSKSVMISRHQTEKKRSNPLEDDTSLRLITTWL